ncbi:histidine phosphatase superfamily [Mycena sp. CBHHK59/15]|nr:histidine phosphatase superfamily [Mycena sp. CBHHK59/15]
MSAASDSKVLGVVILARHGDRAGFYQSPTTYAATFTTITPLGTEQEFQLGQHLRSLYLNASSPSNIAGVNGTLVNQTQIDARADAGGERGVIYDSSVALLQGLFPANTNYTTTLSNGTTVTGALSGYQARDFFFQSVEPNNDITLEGWTSCGAFDDSTAAFYNSTEFAQKQTESAPFLNSLKQYLDGRPVTLENMWNIYDFMNVQSIHSAAFAQALPPTYLAQALTLASWHEYGVFTSPQLDGIGNIAGRAILPPILTSLASIANSSDPLKLAYQAISYKPFLSLFNMTGASQQNPELAGIVNYAAAVALEVRQPSAGGELVLRFNFKNGTGADFVTYNFLNGSGDVPLSTFPAVINTTADWCTVCNNNKDRGCGALALAASQASAAAPVGAGFLGAGLTLAVVMAMFGVLAFLGMLSIGRGRYKKRASINHAEVKDFCSVPAATYQICQTDSEEKDA